MTDAALLRLGYTPAVLADYNKSSNGFGWDSYFGVRLEEPYREVLIDRAEHDRLYTLFEKTLWRTLRDHDFTYTFRLYCDCSCVVTVNMRRASHSRRTTVIDQEVFYSRTAEEFQAAIESLMAQVV